MQLRPGVQTLTVTDATPGARLRLDDAAGTPLVTQIADRAGNAHVAYLPSSHRVVSDLDGLTEVVRKGHVLEPGRYTVFDEDAGVAHGAVRVTGVDEVPGDDLYDQRLERGFGYITMRDGVRLSVNVMFPDENLYGPAPWPTVIEYSGYGPSNPDAPQPGSLIANLLGFAVVGVNIRGTGCSGGIFDVFSPAQAADGHDAVEIVARQDWVLHNRPGMVGLSYPGNTQLFVAATRPPSLAAITPLSVLDDLWRQQWPGGIYNSGFTRVWIQMRDAETRAGGQTWDRQRIEAGDTVAEDNQKIRTIDLDFARFGHAMDTYRDAMRARRAADLVAEIDVPVYLTGSWQDEQTGSRAALMLDRFVASPHTVFTFTNGHHPDGYSPMLINRWFEFLTFHVARRIPQVNPIVRDLAPAVFAEHFGFTPTLEADRFTDHDDFDSAFAAYRSEPPVRLLFESGAGGDVAGAPVARFETTAAAFPVPGTVARRLWLGPGGTLVDAIPDGEGADTYRDDPAAGDESYAATDDFDAFILPTVDYEWTRFPAGCQLVYDHPVTDTFTVAGQGHLDLWLRPGTDDTAVQVTVSEVRPDGIELRVQTGYHRPVHRAEEPGCSELHVDHTFADADRVALVPGGWIHTRVPIMPVAHVFRAGTCLRVAVSTPGRDHPFWRFENPTVDGAAHDVGWGGSRASSIVLPVVDTPEHPVSFPPADAVRGQVCRPADPHA